MLLHGGERLLEAPLDRLGQLLPQLLELCEAPLEVLALRRELRQPLLLLLVLLLRERMDRAERLTPALKPEQALRQRLAIVALRGLGAGIVDPSLRSGPLGIQPRELDLDRRRPLPDLRGFAPELGLAGSQLPQCPCRVARARAAGVDARPQRRVEPAPGLGRAAQR